MAVAVRWGVVTHPGLVRAGNQDSVLAGPRLFAVADGMGGHAAGDVASHLAVTALAPLAAGAGIDVPAVTAAIADANLEIVSQSAAGSGREGMGTTFAGVGFAEDDAASAIVFNVGDSRVYRWSAGVLEQISQDHSVVAELERRGAITADEVESHPERHVITGALGTSGMNEPDLWTVAVVAGDRFLVCSDGLTNEVDADDLALALGSGDPQEVADELLRLALAAGARDNVSAVVVDVVRAENEDVPDGDTWPPATEATPSPQASTAIQPASGA